MSLMYGYGVSGCGVYGGVSKISIEKFDFIIKNVIVILNS